MSSETLKPEIEPSANEVWEQFEKMQKSFLIDRVISQMTNWPIFCDGVCFPLQYRAYLSHPAFEVA